MKCSQQIFHKANFEQFIAYAIVGSINAFLGYGVFALLFYLLQNKIHYLWILTISNIIYCIYSYLNFKLFVFKTTDKNKFSEPLRYMLTYAMCVLINYLVMLACVELFKLHALTAQLIAMSWSTGAGFIFNKIYTFRKRASP